MSVLAVSLLTMETTEVHAVDCDCEPCEEKAERELLARLWPDD